MGWLGWTRQGKKKARPVSGCWGRAYDSIVFRQTEATLTIPRSLVVERTNQLDRVSTSRPVRIRRNIRWLGDRPARNFIPVRTPGAAKSGIASSKSVPNRERGIGSLHRLPITRILYLTTWLNTKCLFRVTLAGPFATPWSTGTSFPSVPATPLREAQP